MTLQQMGLISVLCCLAGCASSDGVRLIDPPTPGLGYRLSHGHHIPCAKSLKPTFRWEDRGAGARYDMAIWDAVSEGIKTGPTERLRYGPGNRIYLRQGLTEPQHQIEITLLPLKQYFWSVKLSADTEWSTYSYDYYTVRVTNSMSLFRTPLGP